MESLPDSLENAGDKVRGAAESYYESEMERWEETKELGPAGTFARGFQFGLTGPAPSIKEGGEVDYGPEPYESFNKSAFTGSDGQSPPENIAGNKTRFQLIVGLIVVVLLVQALAPALQAGATLAAD
jgi:hypothetical protein